METTIKNMNHFIDTEPIWIFTTDFDMKSQIENTLNREISKVDTVHELVAEIENFIAKVDNEDSLKGSMIFTEFIPKDIKSRLDDLGRLLNFGEVKQYEIGINVEKNTPLFEGSLRFAYLEDFIKFARKAQRNTRVEMIDDKSPDKEIIVKLKNDIVNLEENLKSKEDELIKQREQHKDLNSEYNSLQLKISQEIEPELKDKENELKEVQEKLAESNGKVTEFNENVRSLKEKLNEAHDEISGKKVDLKGRNAIIDEKKERIFILEADLEELKERLKEKSNTIDNILSNQVDSETYLQLKNDIETKDNRITKLTKENKVLQINNNKLQYEYEDVQVQLENAMKGNVSIQNIGRTNHLPQHRFNRSTVVYIKTIDALPYRTKLIYKTFEKLCEQYTNQHQHNHILILKHSESIDDLRYPNVDLCAKLEDVDTTQKTFRLFPNTNMFVGAEEFEENLGILLVIDYIQSNEYYISSAGRDTQLNIVNHSNDIERLNLIGSPLSLDISGSLIDMTQNKKFNGTTSELVRNTLLEDRVNELYQIIDKKL